MDLTHTTNGLIRIFDSKGVLLANQAYRNNVEIDVRNLPAGMYLVVVEDQDTGINYRTKLMKE